MNKLTTLPPLPEPIDYQFQHEDTGLTSTVCGQQVEWGFEKNNPRWAKIGGSFSEVQLREYGALCYAQGRADLLAELVPVAYMHTLNPGNFFGDNPKRNTQLLNDEESAKIEADVLDGSYCGLAIIPKA